MRCLRWRSRPIPAATVRSARASSPSASATARPSPAGTTPRSQALGRPTRTPAGGRAWRPGLKGANRTGRPFTGDYAGDLLYASLKKYGFAEGEYGRSPDDGFRLIDCRITNAVRCVPPENKPTPVRCLR